MVRAFVGLENDLMYGIIEVRGASLISAMVRCLFRAKPFIIIKWDP